MRSENSRIVWFLWPFKAFWDLLEGILQLTGRLIAGIIGLVFMVIGLVLTIIIIAAPIGIPLMVFGFLLMIRGIFY